ncbi:MAG: transketolase [Elusimicrobiota bacterium]
MKHFREKSCQVRSDIIRMLTEAKSGHSGGSLSSADLLVAIYDKIMRHDPQNPLWSNRDYFLLSKGHGCPALYATLANCGYFPREELLTLRKFGSRLQGHPAKDKNLPGIEASFGSLGFGLSVGVGLALGLRLDNKDNRVYVLMSDGEQQEGSVWEAAMSSGHYQLDNLCAIIDYNKLQIDGPVEEIMGVSSLVDKYRAFRWHTIEIDGHDFSKIFQAFEEARQTKGKPTLIIAHTIKGKGVSFMCDLVEWHGKAPSLEQAEKALKELQS